AVVHAKVFGGLGLRRHGFGPFGPQNQVRLIKFKVMPVSFARGHAIRGCDARARKSPGRWGERPGVGVLPRGAGGNSFLYLWLYLRTGSSARGSQPACRSGATP